MSYLKTRTYLSLKSRLKTGIHQKKEAPLWNHARGRQSLHSVHSRLCLLWYHYHHRLSPKHGLCQVPHQRHITTTLHHQHTTLRHQDSSHIHRPTLHLLPRRTCRLCPKSAAHLPVHITLIYHQPCLQLQLLYHRRQRQYHQHQRCRQPQLQPQWHRQHHHRQSKARLLCIPLS